MQLSDIYLGLGEEALQELLRSVSIGRLKTYQLYDRLKTRAHLSKLNSENLRKAAPRLWARLADNEDELGADLAQCVLVSHLDMIVAILNHLGIPNDDGFFAKDVDASTYLTGDWQQRVYDEFHDKYPRAVLLFYLNHLAVETAKEGQAPVLFAPPVQ